MDPFGYVANAVAIANVLEFYTPAQQEQTIRGKFICQVDGQPWFGKVCGRIRDEKDEYTEENSVGDYIRRD